MAGSFSYNDTAPCTGSFVALPQTDPRSTAISMRYAPVPSDGSLDPIDDGLSVELDDARPVLKWPDVGAGGYHVMKCSAVAGPCAPSPVAATQVLTWIDEEVSPAAGEILWYQVKAVNMCTFAAGLPVSSAPGNHSFSVRKRRSESASASVKPTSVATRTTREVSP